MMHESASVLSPPTAGLAIQTDQLGMVFGRGDSAVNALRDVDLEVPEGQFLCVMGPSGSGKSTLLHLLAALRAPTHGRVVVGGNDISTLNQGEAARFRRRNIGLVFQFFNLIPTLSLVQNVAVPLLLEGHRLAALHERIDALLDQLGILHRKRHPLSGLSGGELQRVAIARALVADPRLLLADEPTGSLDSRTGVEVLELLAGVCRERGTTTVVMTHDSNTRCYADRVLWLRDGRVEKDTAGRTVRKSERS
jgi:ABC-type lipoprotein export system ATPase subunit